MDSDCGAFFVAAVIANDLVIVIMVIKANSPTLLPKRADNAPTPGDR
jgi:hypothetical protein